MKTIDVQRGYGIEYPQRYVSQKYGQQSTAFSTAFARLCLCTDVIGFAFITRKMAHCGGMITPHMPTLFTSPDLAKKAYSPLVQSIIQLGGSMIHTCKNMNQNDVNQFSFILFQL